MDFLSLEKGSVITPREVVRAPLSGERITEKALALDDVAIIIFTRRDLLTLVEETRALRVKVWSGRNDRSYRAVVEGEGYIRTSGLGRRWAMVVADAFSQSSWEGGFSCERVGTMMRMGCKTIVKRIKSLGNL